MYIRSTILFLLSLPLLFSCSGQDELLDSPGNPEEIPAGVSKVVFRSDGQASRRVYIFRKEGDTFRYHSQIDNGWSADGKMTTRLLIGEYKFLFTVPTGEGLDVLPTPLDKTVTWKQLSFAAKTDSDNPENILPVEELFLPEPEVADSMYTIRGGDKKITCTLTRRVSQLEFVLKRGYKKGEGYVPVPYSSGSDILSMMQELQVELSGVARQCNYARTSGTATMQQTYAAADNNGIDDDGFATFTGPFVFPPVDNQEIDLKITLVPKKGAPYAPLHLKGKLETNKKLVVNLWLNSASFSIGVTYENKDITQRTDGDSGRWE